MIVQNELLQMLKKKSFHAYETVTATNNISTVELVTLESLLDFAKKHDVDSIFYRYGYIQAEDLIIWFYK